MKLSRSVAVAISLVSLTVASLALAQEHTPKVTMEAARTIALARVHGAVRSQEYEKEGGRWIYSFDIRPDGETGKRILEVHVDGDTGKVLGVENESG
jgi:uncharacterized membrane protein YkoI